MSVAAPKPRGPSSKRSRSRPSLDFSPTLARPQPAHVSLAAILDALTVDQVVALFLLAGLGIGQLGQSIAVQDLDLCDLRLRFLPSFGDPCPGLGAQRLLIGLVDALLLEALECDFVS